MDRQDFVPLDPAERERLLADPEGPVRVVIDTDAANELDDQFALAWALLSPERVAVEAIVAEPYSFAHLRPAFEEITRAIRSGGDAELTISDDATQWERRLRDVGLDPEEVLLIGPGEGMERSYEEILQVLELLGVASEGVVFRGSPDYLSKSDTPIGSPGVRRIIELAMATDPDNGPLYILAIGCVTNIVSALLLEPEIARRIVVVWTSGYPSWVGRSNRPSLNLVQDPIASQLLCDSGVPLVYLPGYYIGAQLRISLPEMESHVRGSGAIGDYLYELFLHNPILGLPGGRDLFGSTRVIWDMVNVAWVLDPSWAPSELVPTPRLDDDLRWQPRRDAPPLMREAYAIDRDGIFRDFFTKLAHHAAGERAC